MHNEIELPDNSSVNNLYSLLSVIENTSNDRERAVDRITRVSLWIGMAVVVTTSNINTQSADSITGDRGQPSRPPIDQMSPKPQIQRRQNQLFVVRTYLEMIFELSNYDNIFDI